MDDEELDALMKSRPFRTADATRWYTEIRGNTSLLMTLGSALWGQTSEDLERQLRAPHPEIPSGFDLADFRKLLQWTEQLSSAMLKAQRMRGLSPAVLPPPVVFVGKQGFTAWEARCEIVRRAIGYLEGR